MFGEIAPRYDFLNHFLSLNIDKRWRNFVVKMVPPIGTAPILDLCTGTGDLALTYHTASQGTVPIIGADFCFEMLVRANQKSVKAQSQSTVRFVEADAQHLPFPSDHFQIVTNSFGLRNITDTDQGIREMARVLKPGGRVGILEFSKPRNKIFGAIYQGYFRSILPRIGQIVSRNNQSAYQYLPASVLQFPDGEAMVAKLESHGLKNVRFHPLTFGIATLYVGEKAIR
jgi:demethylmenaquinone methyltransferase / 2-methoxy-6-polyprenyl-1,4-benzoquinol methylase